MYLEEAAKRVVATATDLVVDLDRFQKCQANRLQQNPYSQYSNGSLGLVFRTYRSHSNWLSSTDQADVARFVMTHHH